jgi:selenide,water dikinase
MHTLPQHDVVLLGVGHTNAHVLKMWRMEPIERARLTCVSNFPVVTYSGMLPGVLAGQYPRERMEIDLVRLCAAAGARLIVGSVTGLDRENRALLFADRPPLPFDVLSIGIGSVPTREGLERADDTLLPIKPMQTFMQRLEARLRAINSGHAPSAVVAGPAALPGDPEADSAPTGAAAAGTPSGLGTVSRPIHILIVGGGVGGTEIAFCLPACLKRILGDALYKITIVEAGSQVGGGLSAAAAGEVAKVLASRHVQIKTHCRVVEIAGGYVWLSDGGYLPADVVLWATSAVPPPLLAEFDLPKDDRGFLLTEPTLACVGTDNIFAVGDAGTIRGVSLPKAGVYAVREGPVLWENLQRAVRGQRLVEYRPQRQFLKLLNTGDGSAIGEYAGHFFRGRLMWWLKDRIDGKFMDMYQDYRPMMRQAEPEPSANGRPMRCAGCGGKIGSSVLSRALARLDVPASQDVLVGLAQADDVAVIQPRGGQPIATTVDFFAAPLDDPYLVGRMAALHAVSDVLAKGARPLAALAMATLPVGSPRKQEQLLYEFLAGGLAELKPLGATLAGGHTIEGPQFTVGFTILASQERPALVKGDLQPGDRLILTKPLGTGVLLAAHMQARLKAQWNGALLAAMLRSNQLAAELLAQYDVRAATDVTGFGLAGHLLEMLRAADLAAELDLSRVPLLPGAAELLAEGLESTLAPANRGAEAEMDAAEAIRKLPAFAALFDPQTCGGLLLAVRPQRAEQMVHELRRGADESASLIGVVTARRGQLRRLSVVAGG